MLFYLAVWSLQFYDFIHKSKPCIMDVSFKTLKNVVQLDFKVFSQNRNGSLIKDCATYIII